MDYIKFKLAYQDTIRLGYNETLAPRYSLFDDVKMNNNIIIKFDEEKQTVKNYFNLNKEKNMDKISFHPFMSELFGFSPSYYLYNKIRPYFENKANGELDLIMLNPDIIESIEIEFKRILDKNEESIYIIRDDIKKLAEQANRSYKLRFHKVYACVIIDVKGFEKKTNNIFYRNISSSDLKKINNHLNLTDLNPNIGIIILENIWTSGKNIKDQKGAMIGIMREAIPQQQNSDLSLKIAKEFHIINNKII